MKINPLETRHTVQWLIYSITTFKESVNTILKFMELREKKVCNLQTILWLERWGVCLQDSS